MVAQRLLLFLALTILAGCQSHTPVITTDLNQYLRDDLFPNHHTLKLETMDEVFALSEEMKNFVNGHVLRKDTSVEQIRTLAKGIFDHADLSMVYQNDANTIASETFANGAANCLSLTIMTYALAQYADFGVSFQQVDVPELWVRRDGTSMLNRHINLKLFQKRGGTVIVVTKKDFTVDFNQVSGSKYFPKRVITKQRVMAMFYNNKGVDHLIDNDFEQAYAYFKKGMQYDPTLVDNYTNLGVLYRKLGYLQDAEKNYNFALKISPDDGTTLENLASLYRKTDRLHEADKIERDLRDKRRSNPYYHYLLGQQAFERNELADARGHFRRAITLYDKNHEFHFAMATTLYLLGEKEASQKYMSLAHRYSESKSDELRYQYKLDSYSQLDKR